MDLKYKIIEFKYGNTLKTLSMKNSFATFFAKE